MQIALPCMDLNQFGEQSGLAAPWFSRYKEKPFSIRLLEPSGNVGKNPFPPDESRRQTGDMVVKGDFHRQLSLKRSESIHY
jgi:hypothetical protein